jgi:hypothetical protein
MLANLTNLEPSLADGYWMKAWKLLYLQRAHHGLGVLYNELHHHLLLLPVELERNMVLEAGSPVERLDAQNGSKIKQMLANRW